MKLIPFLGFTGQTHEAFRFYAGALGGRVTGETRYDRMPPMGDDAGPLDPALAALVAHAQLEAGGALLMAADASCAEDAAAGQTTINIEVDSIEVDSIEEAERVFAAMADGGQVQLPLQETFWARRWGWLVDRYGKPWMVNCMKP